MLSIANIIFSEQLSLGMKIFGNDLRYGSFRGGDEIRAALNTLNPFDHFKQILSGRVRI